MNWSTERDALIAQRIAFVQSVSGATPAAATTDAPAKPNPPRPASASLQAASVGPAPTNNPDGNAVRSEQGTEPPPYSALPKNDIRKEFQTRIAAFQAHQHRFHRERDAYFNSVLTKVRSAIEPGDKFGGKR